MLTSSDGWVGGSKKGQTHADVLHEWSPIRIYDTPNPSKSFYFFTLLVGRTWWI